MSADDCKGRYHAIRTFMQSVQRDIDSGARRGADRRYPAADATVRLTWRQQLLQRVNSFRRTA